MNSFENYIELNENPIDTDKIKSVELKISKSVTDFKKELMFKRYTTLKWWCQSVLSNNQKIVCGYYPSDDFVIKKIKEYSLDELVEIGDWNDKICFYQFNNMLTFIKASFNKKKDAKFYKIFSSKSLK